jgi:MFS family permease
MQKIKTITPARSPIENNSTENAAITSSTPLGYSNIYSGYVLLMLFLGVTLSFADRQLINILVEPIKQEFGASDTEMGLLTGLAFVLCYAIVSIPIARLADRSSRRNILAVAMTAWSVMTALCGMSMQFWQLALARFGVGVGEAGGGPASYSMLADYFSPKRRSTALGILATGAPAGILLSMYGGAVVATHYGWRATFLALGIPGVLLAILIWLTVREPQRGLWDAPRQGIESNLGMLQVMSLLWRNPALRMVALASGVTAISGFATAAWMPSFFIRVHDLSLIEAGLALGLGGTIGGMCGGVIGGLLADRLSKRHVSWQLKIAAIGTVLTIPVQALVLLWPHRDVVAIAGMQLPMAVIGVPFSGFFLAFMQGPSIAAVQNIAAPEIRTQASAAFFFVSSILGMSFGPLSVGILNDVLTPLVGEDAVRYGLLASLLFMLLGALLFWRASHFYAEILIVRSASITNPSAKN